MGPMVATVATTVVIVSGNHKKCLRTTAMFSEIICEQEWLFLGSTVLYDA